MTFFNHLHLSKNFFPFGSELFAPCRQGLFFSRCQQKVADGDRQSEAVVRIQPNTLARRERKILLNPYRIPRSFDSCDLPLHR